MHHTVDSARRFIKTPDGYLKFQKRYTAPRSCEKSRDCDENDRDLLLTSLLTMNREPLHVYLSSPSLSLLACVSLFMIYMMMLVLLLCLSSLYCLYKSESKSSSSSSSARRRRREKQQQQHPITRSSSSNTTSVLSQMIASASGRHHLATATAAAVVARRTAALHRGFARASSLSSSSSSVLLLGGPSSSSSSSSRVNNNNNRRSRTSGLFLLVAAGMSRSASSMTASSSSSTTTTTTTTIQQYLSNPALLQSLDHTKTGQPTFEVRNPARPSEILARVPVMDGDDAAACIENADAALTSYWRDTTSAAYRGQRLLEWSRLMNDHAHDIATIMTLESGKPLKESLGEVTYARSFLDYFAAECLRPTGAGGGFLVPSPFVEPGNSAGTAPRGQVMAIQQAVGCCALITPVREL